MAPVELDAFNSNVRPLFLLGGYFFVVGALTSLIIRNVFYRADRSLPPSQTTRHRQAKRRKHVQTFTALSVISVAMTSYYYYDSLSLSYRVWARERGEMLPSGLFGPGGILGGGEENVGLELGRWLKDTSFALDSWEIIVEKSRRFWWSQQILFGTTVWSVFMGLEGRRRNIPYLWAFLSLGKLVAVSYGLNLFFLAILVTPMPLPDSEEPPTAHTAKTRKTTRSGVLGKAANAVKESTITTENAVQGYWQKAAAISDRYMPSKPSRWTPRPVFYILPLITNYIAAFLVPFASSTPSFSTIILTAQLLPYLLLYIDRLIPSSFGYTHNTLQDAHRASAPVFRFMSILSLLLHLKQTILALLDNEPGSHHHRHSSLFTQREEHHSTIKRTSTAVGRVLGSINDHPAVTNIGCDVILCGLSLVLWASIRGLDVREILNGVGLSRLGKAFPQNARETVVDKIVDARDKAKELANELLEPSLLPSPKRGRGRPKKGTSQTESSSLRKSTRKTTMKLDSDHEEEEDETYIPNHSNKPDEQIEGEEDPEEDAEAGVLSWGLLSLGGLGFAGSGVLGAEVCT